MKAFFRERGLGLATITLIMLVISAAQSAISYTMTVGALRHYLPDYLFGVAHGLVLIRCLCIATIVGLWLLKRRERLLQLMIVANALFTVALLGHTAALIATLFASVDEAIGALMVDISLMVVSNILVFSIWYWIIDPPGVTSTPCADKPWDFLFPQRASSLPHYESWVPRYSDYLYLAFTTSFAFSPTDTLPLTRRAKMLMLLQSVISVVTLTGIAGGAINILAGRK